MLVFVGLAPFAERPGASLVAALLGGAAWCGALAFARGGKGTLAVAVGGALCLRAVVLPFELGLSDDVHRAVWEGALVLDAKSPYAAAPSSPERAPERETWPATYARVGHADVPAAYPPATQALHAAAVAIARAFGSVGEDERGHTRAVTWVRVLATAADLLVLALLVRLARTSGRVVAAAVAWGWCPFVVLAFAGSGHHDALAIAFALAAILALTQRRALTAAVFVALGVLAKPLAICVLAGFAHGERHERARRLAVACAAILVVVALAHAPLAAFDGGFRGLYVGLGEYATRWESQSVLFRFVEPLFSGVGQRDGSWSDPRRLARVAVGALWLLVLAVLWWRRASPAAAFAIGVGAFLLLSPTLHPWYVAWLVPACALTDAWTPRLAACAAPLLYAPVAPWVREGRWEEPAWLLPAVIAPILVFGGIEAARRYARAR